MLHLVAAGDDVGPGLADGAEEDCPGRGDEDRASSPGTRDEAVGRSAGPGRGPEAGPGLGRRRKRTHEGHVETSLGADGELSGGWEPARNESEDVKNIGQGVK